MISNSRRKAIWQLIANIGDEAIQRRAWFGSSHTEVWSPDELLNAFFDDLDVPGFVGDSESGLNDAERRNALDLVQRLDAYAKRTEIFSSPETVIDDPEFATTRDLAARLSAARSA